MSFGILTQYDIEASYDFVGLNLEWDETGQAMRIRRGILEVDGTMSVLAACQI